MKRRHQTAVLLVCALLGGQVFSQTSFEIADIRLVGLQRVTAGTVFNTIALQVGDLATELAIQNLVKDLFRTGYFEDIEIGREDNVLLVTLQERPSIVEITIEGEKQVKEEALLEGLAAEGLKEGEIFKQSTLERVKSELVRLYVAQGKYAASIDTLVTELPRNRVAIAITVDEGKNAGIRQIAFVGNEIFSDEELKAVMELKEPTIIGAFKGDNRYSREKMQGDLESIESYYRNRGYVEFRVESTQITMTPDRKQVFITINVSEGEQFTIRNVDLVGELDDIDPAILERFIVVKEGQIYSSAIVTASEERLTAALGNNGYAFATASGIPDLQENGEVDLKFMVNTGKRAYVRYLAFVGNSVTQDHVLRREMRQMEGGWLAQRSIELSKLRLERLGFFKEVSVETPQVAGSDSEVDVVIKVAEQSTGQISFGLGYQKIGGLSFQAGINKNNLAGSGKNIGFSVNWSDYQKSLSYTYTNPYFTSDGISRGISAYVRDTDYSVYNLNAFSTQSVGIGSIFGFPLGETRRFRIAGRIELTDVSDSNNRSSEIANFISSEGDRFLNFKTEGVWSSDTRNRAIFANRGQRHTIGLEAALPGSDLSFFKTQYDGEIFVGLPHPDYAIRLRTSLGFGETYGETEVFPFYEHFFAGGFGSVRGYERHSLGPRSLSIPGLYTVDTHRSYGGNVLVEISTELLFPIPFVDLPGTLQTVFFIDGGNVFNTNCPVSIVNCFKPDLGELRYSTGIGVTLITQMAPMSFAIAFPFNNTPYDEEEIFSFDLSTNF